EDAAPNGDQDGDRRTDQRMSDWIRPRLDGWGRRPELALYLIAALAAWAVRMVQDDAFISFRYSQNLANGHGLVFNPGEKVEGYTNFLWTWLFSIPERLGWDTPAVSV